MHLNSMNQEQIMDCYHYYMEKHFPKDELKPLESILRMYGDGQYLCLGLFFQDSGLKESCNIPASIENLIGYAFIAAPSHCQMTLLDYLAVTDAFREQGYGSQILKELEFLQKKGEIPGKGMLIETEHEKYANSKTEIEIRMRRNAFYRRNGVKESALKVRAFGVPFRIWQLPQKEEATYACMARNYREIYIYMCGEKSTLENVKVPFAD